ncbi:MAG: 4-hydroxy-tetrahydrodipicolinate reductase [Candidatus Nanopelagicales bacterium]
MEHNPLPQRLRIGLMGFGRAGREVARHLLGIADVELCWVVRETALLTHRPIHDVLGLEHARGGSILSAQDVSASDLISRHPVDVIIDFSSPSGIDFYGTAAVRHGVSVVSAVSHYDSAHERRLRWLSRSTPVLWSPNITLGVNVVMLAAQIIRQIAPHADIQIVEEHFKQKAQVSGTALRLADSLGVPATEVMMVRAGGIVGTHEVLFGLPTQLVRLRHEAISREAFGDGALFAARRITGLVPQRIYTMDDLLRPYFTLHSEPDTLALAIMARSMDRIPA